MFITRSTSVRWIVTGCLVAALAASGSPTAATATSESLVVFGTSLSDPGNAYVFTGGTNSPPEYSVDAFKVPSRPYDRGGHHFSNGKTWIEQYAELVGLESNAAFANASPEATNFAVGAARAREDGKNVNLPTQVGAFMVKVGGVASPTAQYVIEMGSNDVRDSFVEFAGGGNGAGVIQDALASIAGNILALYGAGARKFVVFNVPKIAVTPAVRQIDALNPGAAQLIDLLVQIFNGGLHAVVTSLSVLPGIDIRVLDAYQTVTDVVGDPAGFGMTNVTDACILPNIAPYACQDPDQYLFWDGIHPTRAMHGVVAQRAASLLGQ